jgi:uncharacterized protein YccT (UPF0319 family)
MHLAADAAVYNKRQAAAAATAATATAAAAPPADVEMAEQHESEIKPDLVKLEGAACVLAFDLSAGAVVK